MHGAETRMAACATVLIVMVALAVCGGCDKVELARDLEPGVANAMVERLSQKGVQARAHELSPAQVAVEVGPADVSRAVRQLNCAILAEPRTCQVAESSLLPTPREDTARQRGQRECELSRDLAHVPGVLRGQVRIAASEKPALDAVQSPASVSVWLETSDNFEEDSVRRFLKGAIPNLQDQSIQLVATRNPNLADRASISRSPEKLVRLGPLRLAPQSLAVAKIILSLLLGTNLLMAITLVLVWRRNKRRSEQ